MEKSTTLDIEISLEPNPFIQYQENVAYKIKSPANYGRQIPLVKNLFILRSLIHMFSIN